MNSQPTAGASSLPQPSRAELSLKGTRISPGLASGRVWVAGDLLDRSAETHRIEPHQVDAEMERVRRAILQVEAELEESARRVSEQIDPSLAGIFRAHQLMLESLRSSNEFETEMRESLTSAAETVKSVFRKWEAKFAAIQDETLRQRADDIARFGPASFAPTGRRGCFRTRRDAGRQRAGNPATAAIGCRRPLACET